MKKIVSATLVIASFLILSACSAKAPAPSVTPAPQPEPVSATLSPTPTSEPPPEPSPEPEAQVHPYYEGFSFRCDEATLTIDHNLLTDCWSLPAGDGSSVDTAATLDENGNLTLSHEGDHWNFHFQGADLIFDGGSPLFARSAAEANTPAAELAPGQLLSRENVSYVYSNIPYVMDFASANWKAQPGSHENTPPKILLDIEQGRYILWDSFGAAEEGRLEFIRNRIKLGQGANAYIVYPEDHRLRVPAHFFYSPMYLSANERILFYPQLGTDTSDSAAFSMEYAPEPLPADNFLLTREEFMVYSKSSEPIPEGFLTLECVITLYPFDDLCMIGREIPVLGSFREAHGELVLTAEGQEYIFLRQGNQLIQTGGSPLYLQGSYRQGAGHIREALPMGSVFPLCSRSGLRSGTYRWESEAAQASLTLNLETMEGTFVNHDGTEHTGTLTLGIAGHTLEGSFGKIRFSPDGFHRLRMANSQYGSSLLPVTDAEELCFTFVS